MEFFEVSIETTHEGIDTLIAALQELGIRGFEIEDSADFNEFLETVTPHWDYVDEDLMKLKDETTKVKIYPPMNEQGRDLLVQVNTMLDGLKNSEISSVMGNLTTTVTNVKDDDWINNYKKYFKPFPVGERLYIKPSWEELPDNNNRLVLEIDPSSSFGTGSHETTKLCLCALEQSVKDGMEVLDMGCGSGILSIAALLCGAKHVCCVDIDENCLVTTRENMERNNFGTDRYTPYAGNAITDTALFDSITSRQYDLIASNIVADVIIAMRSLFVKCLKPGGQLMTSGIIGPRADEVGQKLLDAGFIILERQEMNDWVLFKLTL